MRYLLINVIFRNSVTIKYAKQEDCFDWENHDDKKRTS